MMSVTHAAIAAAVTAAGLGTADPWVIATAAIASQLPDIDTSNSFVGRVVWPFTNFLEQRFPHRSITHSFAATGAISFAAGAVFFYFGWPWLYWGAFALGYFMGWFADAFTKSGVEAFYPNPARLVIPGNPNARLSTHSKAEYWVLAIAIALLVASVNITSAGGVSETVSMAFFRDSGSVAELFQKYGATERIYADVEGIHVFTSQPVDSRFEVIAIEGEALIAENQDSGRLYKIGKAPDVQIRPVRVKPERGELLKITSQSVPLEEMGVLEWLATIPQNAYLSGTLSLDDIEELQIPSNLEAYSTIRLWGGQLELSNARPADVAAMLQDFWILQGNVIVKVRA